MTDKPEETKGVLKPETDYELRVGWKCLRCNWVQHTYKPEPPFAPKGCDCDCWDFECPKCGCDVSNFEPEA